MHRLLTLAIVLALSAGAADAKSCKDAHGKFTKCPAAATSPAPATAAPSHPSPMAATMGGVPHCVKGKLCGHACIAVTKTCHK